MPGLACVMLALLLSAAHAAGPSAAVVYAFEVQAQDLGRNDTQFESYGFAPVGGLPLFTNGVRGALTWDSGLTVGLGMRAATSSRGRDAVVPTFLQSTTTSAEVSGRIVGPLRAGGDIGFQATSMAVGSTVQGGALVYLGPFVQPRVTVRLVDGPGVVELAAGWFLHVPLGDAHDNALWEEPFDRTLFQGPTIAVHSGFGTRGWK